MRLDSGIGSGINAAATALRTSLIAPMRLRRPTLLQRNLILLALLAGAMILLFMTIDVDGQWDFVLPRRARKVAAMVIVGVAISYSTLLFQTASNNRILTPSIIGFDALYMLIQTVIVFVFGALALQVMNATVYFLLNVGLMVGFALVLYRWLFQHEGRNLYYLVLVGVVFGTFFGSMTSFLQRLINPNDFTVLQDRMFASFNSVNKDLLLISAVILTLTIAVSLRGAHSFDVVSLGREHAVNLGLDHNVAVRRMMIAVAILVSVSTALVGPITFLGLLVANLAYQFMPTYRHAYLAPAAALLAIVALTGGQLLVEHVFTFSTSLSVIVNFVGGAYFMLLLLKESRV